MLSSWSTADTPTRFAFAMITALCLLRLVMICLSTLELGVDEAQYWRWSTSLDWGYYSKPPMIAWVIAASTTIFGHDEWAIRILMPILHSISALFLWALSRRMFGPSAALVTVAAYLMMPGVFVSSAIISTDGVLFTFWCAALYALWRLRDGDHNWGYALLLGAGIGGGLLSKYAMSYFVIGVVLTLIIDKPTRRALFNTNGIIAAGVAIAIFAPHIWWNITNDFQTVGHTVDNANLGQSDKYNLENILTFFTNQMGVFGPISFLGLFAALTFARSSDDKTRSLETWLACFIVPVLIFIAFQAFLTRANANWAATAYPAACVLIGSLFLRTRMTPLIWLVIAALTAIGLQFIPETYWLTKAVVGVCVFVGMMLIGYVANWRSSGAFWTGAALHTALALVLGVLMITPPSVSGAMGLDNGFKRLRGWQDISEQLIREANAYQPSAIVVDEREIWHGIDYYSRDRLPAPLILWRYNQGAKNFAETQPMTDALDDRVLLASERSSVRLRIQADYETWDTLGVIGTALGTRSNGCPLYRELKLYEISGFAPRERNNAWVREFKTVTESGKLEPKHLDRNPPCPPLPAD